MSPGTGASRGKKPLPSVALARGRSLHFGPRALLMGVVNATPDSFYPGSRKPRHDEAIEHALRLVEEGADIIDVGGESTRPGSSPVAEAEELERVLPVLEGIRKASDVALSIDTQKASVAEAAIIAGADIVNDVSGGLHDPAMAKLIARHGAIALLMHMRGTPKTMQELASYDDVMLQVKAELGVRVAAMQSSGVPAGRVWIDPGIGFGKTARQSFQILSRLDELLVFEKPVVVGTSRKSFIGKALGEPSPEGRLLGSIATATLAALRGAHVLRVHDVAATRAAARIVEAVLDPDSVED